MNRFLFVSFAAFLMSGAAGLTRADDKDAKAILDKAIKAMGGEEKLSKVRAYSVKDQGNDHVRRQRQRIHSSRRPCKGLDHYRSEFEGKFGDNDIKGVTVLNGDKGWRKFGDKDMDMEATASPTRSERSISSVIPVTHCSAKGKGFKIETAGEEKVGDKPAAVVKVTGPDGKDFKLFFDKESGLPVKLVATVVGFDGDEFTQETTYEQLQRLRRHQEGHQGRQRSATARSSSTTEITEFKVLDKVEPDDAFDEPK